MVSAEATRRRRCRYRQRLFRAALNWRLLRLCCFSLAEKRSVSIDSATRIEERKREHGQRERRKNALAPTTALKKRHPRSRHFFSLPSALPSWPRRRAARRRAGAARSCWGPALLPLLSRPFWECVWRGEESFLLFLVVVKSSFFSPLVFFCDQGCSSLSFKKKTGKEKRKRTHPPGKTKKRATKHGKHDEKK